MKEIKGTEINEVKKPELENFKNIKPERGMDAETSKGFWDNLFEKAKDFVDSKMERDDVLEKTFSNQDEMKEQNLWDEKDLRESKPENSPDPLKWFEKGGEIKVEETGGKKEWTYINKDGIEVKYVDGYPVFPDKAKHPIVGDINIGSFTGDREKDKSLCKKILKEIELSDVLDGFVIHHDSKDGILQLIKKEYHEEFTHKGGYSKYKEENN